ncbi:MAG: hypothetical protein ACT4O2_01265 [Beijerinckiaceae bacterium]
MKSGELDRADFRAVLLLLASPLRLLPVAAPAGRDFVHAGLDATGIDDRPNGQALKERAARDVLGELLDRYAGLVRRTSAPSKALVLW